MWFARALADCSGCGFCVTSLNMRKWMRERLQRRKKKPTEEASQPAPPPLQPAYFDETPTAAAEPGPAAETVEPTEPTGTSSDEPTAGEAALPEQSSTAAGTRSEGARTRGRRRRGGRGRGGRGREQAVAQAFAPATEKGIIPEPLPGATQEAAAEVESEPSPEPEIAAPGTHTPQAPVTIPDAPPRPPKGIVILAIGLPGSGKSTWFKRHNVVPLSSDMMRSLLFDDIREQRFQDLVFSNLRSILKARLIAKRPMNYVDATNLTPQERHHWIKLAKDYHYEVHAVFFDVPLEVCVERHNRRDRVVPEDIMRRMAAKLKPPSFDEGFAKITVVRVKKKEPEPAEP